MSRTIATYSVEIRVANGVNEAGINTLADYLGGDTVDIEAAINDAVLDALADLPEDLLDHVTITVRETPFLEPLSKEIDG